MTPEELEVRDVEGVRSAILRELKRLYGPDNAKAFEDDPLHLGVSLLDGSFVNVRIGGSA